MARNHRNQKPYRPPTDHKHIVTHRDTPTLYVMAGHGKWLDQRRVLQRKTVRQNVNGMGRDIPLLLERPLCVDADEFQLVADMLMSCLASRTIAAMIQWAHHNVLPYLKPCDAFAKGSYLA